MAILKMVCTVFASAILVGAVLPTVGRQRKCDFRRTYIEWSRPGSNRHARMVITARTYSAKHRDGGIVKEVPTGCRE